MIRWMILRFLEAYFRHPWWYWIPILGMGLLAGLSLLFSNPIYISRSTLYVNKDSLLSSLSSVRENGLSWLTPADVTVGELREMLATDAFVRSIVQLTDLEAKMTEGAAAVEATLSEARKAVWVESLGTNLVQVGAAHEESKISQQLVSSVIEVYIRWKINADRDEGAETLSFLNEQVAVYGAQLQSAEEDLLAYLETHPVPLRGERPASEAVQVTRLERVVDAARSTFEKAQDDLQDAKFNAAVTERRARQTYLLVDAPLQSETPEISKKKLIMSLGIFLVAGVMLSGVAILGAALLDRSVYFAGEAEDIFELPVLAVLPSWPTLSPFTHRFRFRHRSKSRAL